jgi:hypothetical protein
VSREFSAPVSQLYSHPLRMFESADFLPTESDRAELARERFLTSHRAIAACSREFAQLAQSVVERAGALRQELLIEEEPEIRLTPERCIIQVGPVALTIAWLRGPLDSLTDGRLLIIAWRGTIGRRRFSELPVRRSDTPAAQTAVSISEEVYLASAENEVTWAWQSEADPSLRCNSATLASRSVDRLRDAWSMRAAS